jgi:uncharacterized membrane protein
MTINSYSGIIFWVLTGILLALLFAYLQHLTLKHIPNSDKDAHKILSKSMWQSALRVLICIVLIFFSFSASIESGLAFLIAFLLTRWVSLFLLFNKSKPQ